jgi:hypothetical protein
LVCRGIVPVELEQIEGGLEQQIASCPRGTTKFRALMKNRLEMAAQESSIGGNVRDRPAAIHED